MKNLIACALILAVLSLVLSLLQYGINVTEIYIFPPQLMVLIWPASILLNGIPIILISYVFLKQQPDGEWKQNFNKQGYKK